MATVVAKGDRLVSAYQAGAILARAAILEGEDGRLDLQDLVDSFETGYRDAIDAAVLSKQQPVCAVCLDPVTILDPESEDHNPLIRHKYTGTGYGYIKRPHMATLTDG